ncbi:DUF3526 domain-containing protein [Eilatimonas milleporae]|uniref:ABC-2 type transport system permease protein n=1 Tax=Eilatimonas milleporae TaxID=911205 RepID=A0A3M0CCV2_9PROT|nr:DUF3526 domain-containing protein [Eilatimonas milleporae]RMB07654.1 ABC-2 type transport system permease protein [Eilatimonas milleporae]
MTSAIALNEIRLLTRNGPALALAVLLTGLMVAAALASVQRTTAFEAEHMAAEKMDRTVWDGQGARNPHSAAHFARYAFKPVPSLSAFDPGIVDHAGIAIWMEAHYRDPALFRRAEDTAQGLGLAALTPAWVLQSVGPLVIILLLFSTIAGEREDGTLRQLVASGVAAPAIISGKLLGGMAAMLLVLAPALGVGVLITAGAGHETSVSDFSVRLIGLVALYTVYFIIMGLIAVGVSALVKTRRDAFLTLIAIWAAMVIVMPVLSAGMAGTIFKQQGTEDIQRQLSAASSAYWEDSDKQDADKAELMARYGVSDVKDMPVNWEAYQLQKSEEDANPLFDAIYGELDTVHARQETLMSATALMSPTVAVAFLSSGLAGTDRIHHVAYAAAAEGHRRDMVKQLNEDMFNNAGEAGYRYTADRALWTAVEDFAHIPPRFTDVASRYIPSLLIIALYLAGGFAFAYGSIARARKTIAVSGAAR